MQLSSNTLIIMYDFYIVILNKIIKNIYLLYILKQISWTKYFSMYTIKPKYTKIYIAML